MNLETSIDPIIYSIEVNASPQETFDLFVDKFASWYPKAYTWSGEKLDTIEIGTHEGGRCFERGPHHFEADWGRVLAYRPPERLVFSWQISYNRVPLPDPAQASEIEVVFTGTEDEQLTEITLRHYKFEQHGEDRAKYREALASPEGWPYILNLFKKFTDER